MKNTFLKNGISLFISAFIIQGMAFCQLDSSHNSQRLFNVSEYNNLNIRWGPHGIVRVLDSGALFCNIKTNIEPVLPWLLTNDVKSVLWKNLNDTAKDFATHVLLSEIYNLNCCKLIDNYSLSKGPQYLWRRSEKEQCLTYWKTALCIN